MKEIITELAINPVSKFSEIDTKEILKEEKEKEENKNKKYESLYEKEQLIDKGAFGSIYIGIQKSTGDEVVLKIELNPQDNSVMHLKYEYKIYQILQGGPGIPKIYDYFHEEKEDILVMELLGPSLEKIFIKNNKKFSLTTVLMIWEQILYIIEHMHSKDLIHRDIKPGNFLIGKGNKKSIIYAIDFGLSKKYKDSKSHLHIPYRDGKDLTGTARFVSINTHLGIDQSRRDDIESIGYMMVYFLKGNLPWMGLGLTDRKKIFEKISEIKKKTSLDILCQGLPKEIITFIQYARNMNFEDKPNYKYLRSLVRKMAKNNGIKLDYNKFDWIVNNLVNS